MSNLNHNISLYLIKINRNSSSAHTKLWRSWQRKKQTRNNDT